MRGAGGAWRARAVAPIERGLVADAASVTTSGSPRAGAITAVARPTGQPRASPGAHRVSRTAAPEPGVAVASARGAWWCACSWAAAAGAGCAAVTTAAGAAGLAQRAAQLPRAAGPSANSIIATSAASRMVEAVTIRVYVAGSAPCLY